MGAGLLLGLLLQAQAADPGARPRIGDPAPALEARARDGRTLRRQDLTGAPTVVEFFATWCLPCRRSLADVARVAAERSGAGPLRILVIGTGEEPALVRRFFDEHPLPPGALLAFDPDGRIGRRWGQDRLPTTFVLDRGAVIRHINRGHGPGFRARLARWLARLDAPQPAP